MPTDTEDALVFRAKPLAPGEVRLRKLRAREALSQLYHYDVLVETQSREELEADKLEALIGAEAYIAFGESEDQPMHGIVRDVELCGQSAPGQVLYRLTLVPKVWVLTRQFHSRVFQDMSVPEIVQSVLVQSELTEDDNFSLRIAAEHPTREYTVQYQETDLDFIQRLMEYEGMFFFFEQGESGEVLVIADSNHAFGSLSAHEKMPYIPPAGARVAEARGIQRLARRRRVVERGVVLVDYNYRTPAVNLMAEAVVDDTGMGQRVVYGEHFKTVDDGKRLAAIRAEERRVNKDVYKGRSNVAGLHVGVRFKLEGHDFAALDQDYVMTEMKFAADQGWASTEADVPKPYRARFEAIPAGVAFRPRRTTPWPRVMGLLHAKVDGVQRTSIDEHGRYKILLPFDSATPGSGRASRWIRMAQPLSGPSGKMHFPLEVGTEVLLGHIDGDPDRPIIVTAVPNHQTPSPVVAANAMQSVILTRSGIRMILDDEAGPT